MLDEFFALLLANHLTHYAFLFHFRLHRVCHMQFHEYVKCSGLAVNFPIRKTKLLRLLCEFVFFLHFSSFNCTDLHNLTKSWQIIVSTRFGNCFFLLFPFFCKLQHQISFFALSNSMRFFHHRPRFSSFFPQIYAHDKQTRSAVTSFDYIINNCKNHIKIIYIPFSSSRD